MMNTFRVPRQISCDPPSQSVAAASRMNSSDCAVSKRQHQQRKAKVAAEVAEEGGQGAMQATLDFEPIALVRTGWTET